MNLRHKVERRERAFIDGLKRLGFSPKEGLPSQPDGIFVTWNRIGMADAVAKQYEAAGLPVIVVENAAWGNGLADHHWLTLGRGRHNTRGCFPVGDGSRWDRLGIELGPWRSGPETVVLSQRGIGTHGMPRNWPQDAAGRFSARIRPHPGKQEGRPLARDLARCGRAVTWGSGAAVKALMMGVPVVSEMPNWVGGCLPNDDDRLRMFRELAWAQWTLDEIATGAPMAMLL